MTTDWTENGRGLKILIAVMTTLLVAGLIALVVGMIKTAREAKVAPGVHDVALPAGATVRQVATGEGQVLIWVSTAEGEVLIVIDPATGKEISRLRLLPQ